MRVDLHTHTTASDGQYTPSEVVRMAKNIGLKMLAITDHDTIDGIDEAIQAGNEQNIIVIPGVELGTKENPGLHILGYNFDSSDQGLYKLCQTMRNGRDERKYRIINFLHEKGVDISLEEVEAIASGRIIARPHFAQVLVKRGYVNTTREAFNKYLDTDEYQKIERFKASAQICIQTIKQAGGKAVMAHPYQVKLSNTQLEQLVIRLKDYGLEGLECFYPTHTPEQVKFYLKLAKRLNLHVTAGSDFHGEQVKPNIRLCSIDIVDIAWLLRE